MLNKMRWKFIIASMSAVLLVILAVVTIIYGAIHYHVVQFQDEILENILDYQIQSLDDELSQLEIQKNVPLETLYSIQFFIVRCDSNGNTLNIYNDYAMTISKEEAKQYTKDIICNGNFKGFCGVYRYMVKSNGDQKIIVFLNSSELIENSKSLLAISSTIALVSFGIMFILVIAVSKKVITPYIRNIERQKQFITDASHEIKTPLTSITTSADVLAMEYEKNEWITNIQNQSLRLTKLVNNLIALSRLDEENPLPNKSTFSISDAVWESAEPFSSLAKAKNKDYSQNIQDDLTIYGDKSSIQQMISILLDNAIKYSDDNGTIKLNLYKKYGHVVLEIFNTCNLPKDIEIKSTF